MTGPILPNHNDHSIWSIINKTPGKKILPSSNYKSKWASIYQNSWHAKLNKV